MQIFSHQTEKFRMHIALSAAEFLFWFATATASYLTVFLQKNGFDATQVGLINSINSAIAICAAPFWGMVSDRMRSLRRVFIICMCVGMLFWALVPLSAQYTIGSVAVLFFIIPIGSFFRMPAGSLFDAFVVQSAAHSGVVYGSVRIWGSISYAVMCFILAAVLPLTGIEITFYLYGLLFLPLIILMVKLKDPGTDGRSMQKPTSLREMQLNRLFKNYHFVSYLIFSIAFTMPMNTSLTFLPYLIEQVGGDSAQLGMFFGYKALLEIPMLLLVQPLRRRISLPSIMLLSAGLFAAEFLLYTVAPSSGAVLAIQTLHGLAGGLSIGVASNYVFALAPEGLNGTAQTVNGSMNSIAAIVGNLLGGMLITSVGIRNFYLVSAGIVLAAGVYFIAALRFGRSVLHQPLPDRAMPLK